LESYRKKLDPSGKLQGTDPWYMLKGVFNASFDKLEYSIAQAKKVGRFYVASPFPLYQTVEISHTQILKSIYQDPSKFPKMKEFAPKGTWLDRLLSKSLVGVVGDQWKTQRKHFDPAFKRSFLMNMVPTFHNLSLKIVKDWETKLEALIPVQDAFLKVDIYNQLLIQYLDYPRRNWYISQIQLTITNRDNWVWIRFWSS
jgi:hypothetical protein